MTPRCTCKLKWSRFFARSHQPPGRGGKWLWPVEPGRTGCHLHERSIGLRKQPRWNSVLALHETNQRWMGRKSERALAVTARKCAQMTTSRDSARSNDVRVSWLEQGMDAPCPPCRISPARGLLLRGADAPARSPARGGRPCAADPFWWGQRIRDGFSHQLAQLRLLGPPIQS